MRTHLFYTNMFKSNIEIDGYKIIVVQKQVKVLLDYEMHRVIIIYIQINAGRTKTSRTLSTGWP